LPSETLLILIQLKVAHDLEDQMAMPERRKTVNVVNDSISDSANSHPCCDSSDFIEDMSIICDDM